MQVTGRELATVLAALRHWQEAVEESGVNDLRAAFARHFANWTPLSADEIDSLCERLNCGQVSPRQVANRQLAKAAPKLLAVCQKIAKAGAVVACLGLGDELKTAIAEATAPTSLEPKAT